METKRDVKIKTYTPEERAERRRRSSVVKSREEVLQYLVGDTDDASEASWMEDLRAQGIDVDEFLEVEAPAHEKMQKRLSIQRRLSVLEIADRPERRSILKSLRFQELSPKELVEVDSKNYNWNATNRQTIEKNRAWALEMARKRAAEMAADPELGFTLTPAPASASPVETPAAYPKVPPPEIRPFPPLGPADFETVVPPTPRELGTPPPACPVRPINLVSTVPRQGGIATGVVDDAGAEALAPDAMVVVCEPCGARLRCPRRVSLARCGKCKKVVPACPAEDRANGSYPATPLPWPAQGFPSRRAASEKLDVVREFPDQSRHNRSSVL